MSSTCNTLGVKEARLIRCGTSLSVDKIENKFHGNGLAIYHCLPYIMHIIINNRRKSVILNLSWIFITYPSYFA